MNKPSSLNAGRIWSPEERAILQLLTSGPQLMRKSQIAVCLQHQLGWRAISKSLKRLQNEGWIKRMPVLMPSVKTCHAPRRVIVPQESLAEFDRYWHLTRQEAKQHSRWERVSLFAPSRQLSNLFGQDPIGQLTNDRHVYCFGLGQLLAQLHCHHTIEAWEWVWLPEFPHRRQRVLGICFQTPASELLASAIATQSRTELDQLIALGRQHTITLELW